MIPPETRRSAIPQHHYFMDSLPDLASMKFTKVRTEEGGFGAANQVHIVSVN